MTKQDERDATESTFNKCRNDEPVFVVCARDILAPHTVLDWCDRAEILGVDGAKVASARALATEMINWQRRNEARKPD